MKLVMATIFLIANIDIVHADPRARLLKGDYVDVTAGCCRLITDDGNTTRIEFYIRHHEPKLGGSPGGGVLLDREHRYAEGMEDVLCVYREEYDLPCWHGEVVEQDSPVGVVEVPPPLES